MSKYAESIFLGEDIEVYRDDPDMTYLLIADSTGGYPVELRDVSDIKELISILSEFIK